MDVPGDTRPADTTPLDAQGDVTADTTDAALDAPPDAAMDGGPDDHAAPDAGGEDATDG